MKTKMTNACGALDGLRSPLEPFSASENQGNYKRAHRAMTRRLFCLAMTCCLLVALLVTPLAASEVQIVTETGYITMRDGRTQLAYTVVRPVGQQVPTLLIYQGYSDNVWDLMGATPDLARKGYAVLGVSLRGTGCSSGEWNPFSAEEATDGYDVIEWVAGSSGWSNGRVALIGESYAAITQFPVAALRPPHLVAMAAVAPMSDPYRDVLYPGGVFNQGLAGAWSGWQAGMSGLAAATGGMKTGSSAAVRRPMDATCAAHQSSRPAGFANGPAGAFRLHPWDDDFMRARAAIHRASEIDVPVFAVVSWQDQILGSRGIDVLTRLKSYEAYVANGDHGFGFRAATTRDAFFNFLDTQVATEPAVEQGRRVTVLWEASSASRREERWRSELGQWPPPEAKPEALFLGAGGTLASSPPGTEAPDARFDQFLYAGPTGHGPGYWADGPSKGSVTYTSPPLDGGLVAVGSASLNLWVTSTARDTDLQVTLSEVRGVDGKEMYVQQGWLRASHRALDHQLTTETRPYHTHREAAPDLSATEPAELRIEILPFAHVFRPGSRIRITIEAPRGVPALNTAAPGEWAFESQGTPSATLVHHDAGHPSALVLSRIPGDDYLLDYPACGAVLSQPCR